MTHKLIFGECDCCGQPNRVLHRGEAAGGLEAYACSPCRCGSLADDADDIMSEMERLSPTATTAEELLHLHNLRAALADATGIQPPARNTSWKAAGASRTHRRHNQEGSTMTDKADIYLIWSNEHRAWWRPSQYGYTTGLDSAGRFHRAKAIEICRQAIPTATNIGLISEIPVRLVDVEDFLKDQMVPREILQDNR